MRGVLFSFEKMWVLLTSAFYTTYTANKCGHKTKERGFMNDDDYTSVITTPLAENGIPDYCINCIGNMSINCAWCGNLITIGDPITLYAPKEIYRVPDYAVSYTRSDDKKVLIGCLRWYCANSMDDRAGFWVLGKNGLGIVSRTHTSFEVPLVHPDPNTVTVDDVTEVLNPALLGKMPD